jgi:hypothetical protein
MSILCVGADLREEDEDPTPGPSPSGEGSCTLTLALSLEPPKNGGRWEGEMAEKAGASGAERRMHLLFPNKGEIRAG